MDAIARRPSAFIPVAMSLAALGLIAAHIATAGVAPQRDEGIAAHLWQLLMATQIPLILYFAATGLPRAPRSTSVVLAVQLLAVLAAVAPVAILRW
jgi:spore maturation protein SpmB